MNKKLVLLLVLACICFNSYSYLINIYSRTTRNGGTNGYQYTHKVVYDDGLAIKIVYIECSNPGNEQCPSLIAPADAGDVNDYNWVNELVADAVNQIALNITSGTRTEVVGIIGSPTQYRRYVLTWGLNASGDMVVNVTREDL